MSSKKREPVTKRRISRRDFVKLVGVGAAGLSLGGLLEACAPAPTPPPAPTPTTAAAPAAPTPTSPPAATAAPAPTATPVPAAPTPKPKEPVTITYWENEMVPGWKGLIDEFVKEFEAENPNIKVKWTLTNWNEVYQKAITAAGAGQLPDIWHTNYTYNAAFIKLGVVYPINEFLTPDFVDQFIPAMFEQGVKVGDKIYGLVNGSASRGLYFNKEILRAAGILYPPETYDEMLDQMKKIAQLPDRWGYILQTKGEQGDQDFDWRLWSNGGELVTKDRKPGINTPEGYDSLQWWVDRVLIDKVTQPNVVDTDYGKKIELYKGGRAGMIIDGSWWQGDLLKTSMDWGTAAIPKTKFAFNQVVTNDYLLNVQTKDKEAAWLLMKKTAEDKWALRRDKFMYLTAFKKTYAEDAFFTTDPRWKAFFLNLDNPHFLPGDVPKWQAMTEELRAQQQLAFMGEKTPQQVLDDTAAKWVEWLKE